MRTSYIALLSLAASTVAPVIAAPLSYSRSKAGGTTLNTRDSFDGGAESRSEIYTPEARSDIPEQLAARNHFDNLMAAIAKVKTREPEVPQEDGSGVVEQNVPRDSESSKHTIDPNDVISAMLNGRGLSPGQEMQARGFWGDILNMGLTFVENIIRRDVTPERLAVRDSGEDFLNSIINSRDSVPSGLSETLNALLSSRGNVASDELAARNDEEDLVDSIIHSRNTNSFIEALNALSYSRRDVATDELAARDSDWESFVKMMNTRRDTIDNFLDKYTPKHATREPSPQQETQARDTTNSPQDSSATKDFITALLNSRESSESLTAHDVLSIASLASRALDELD